MPGRGDRILITGAGGFLGAALARACLASGAEVGILVRQEGIPPRLREVSGHLRISRGDVLDADVLARWVRGARPTHFLHAVGTAEPIASRLHVQSMLNLMEVLPGIEPPTTAVLGSSTVYAPQDRPLVESDPLGAISSHGAAKAASSLLATEWARRLRFPLVELRLFQVFGPWDREDRLLPTLFRAALQDLPMAMPPAWARRDWFHLEDAVHACLASLDARLEPGCIVNVGSGIERTFQEVVDAFAVILGRPLRRGPDHPGRPWDRIHWCADIRRAETLLGWRPRIAFEAGLASTWNWYRSTWGAGHA